MLPGKKRFVMGASGHIAGVINPPAKNKRTYWTERQAAAKTTQTWLEARPNIPAAGGPTGPSWLQAARGQADRRAQGYGKPATTSRSSRRPGRYVKAEGLSSARRFRNSHHHIQSLRRYLMEDIVIVSAARTAVGKFGGIAGQDPGHRARRHRDQGAAGARQGRSGDQVGEVIMGQVLAAGAGQNPARQALLKAGLPKEVPGMTINAVCGSGLKAVMLAAQAIARRRHRDRHRRRPGEHERWRRTCCRTRATASAWATGSWSTR